MQYWGGDVYPKLSWFRQDKVQSAHIMVVGCGALGNEVLKNLVLFGVGHLVVVDFDCVEPSNLTRSVLFRQSDAVSQRSKVEAVAERLLIINPDVDVKTIKGDVTHDVGLGLLRRMDVVIGCVDNRYARYCLNRLCMRAGVPWVDGGIEALEGTARVFAPGKNCYACNLGPEGLKELSRRRSCSEIIKHNEEVGRVPTTPVVASVIGAVQVQEAIKLIHREEMGKGELTSLCGKMFYYEGQHLTSRIVEFQAYDDDCPCHEDWSPVVASSLNASTTVGEALLQLSEMLKEASPTICLQDHSFVDYVVNRANDERTRVMLPDYSVADYVARHGDLCKLPFSQIYQHELHTVGMQFPYQELTLAQLGIPTNDVLHVMAGDKESYIEMKEEKL